MRHSGFTLLEILVVVVIVGVLAAVALPSYYKNVELSRGAEAKNTLGIIKRALDACYNNYGSYQTCNSWNAMGMADPGIAANSHFQYNVLTWGGNGCQYTIGATRTTLDGGDTNDTLYLALFYGENVSWCGLNNYDSFTLHCSANACLP